MRYLRCTSHISASELYLYKNQCIIFLTPSKTELCRRVRQFFFANTLSYLKPCPEAFSLTIFKDFSLFQWPTKHQKKYFTSVSSIPFDWRLKNSSRRWRRICGNLLVFFAALLQIVGPACDAQSCCRFGFKLISTTLISKSVFLEFLKDPHRVKFSPLHHFCSLHFAGSVCAKTQLW